MFRKLRNKLILINLGITSIVIITSFTAIYLFATNSAKNRPPIPETETQFFTDDFENYITITIRNEQQAAARDLLIMLIVSGIAIEFVVAIVSYILAEEAIKPIREAYESQKVFIANASHEIKTPLAAISANLEAADIHGNKWITNIERETDKLTALNSELLTLARTDLISDTKQEMVDLNRLVTDSLKSLEPRMAQINLRTTITTEGKVKLNRDDFLQIFNILIDNAIKYCDKKITISLSNHELTIINDGAKISKDNLPHIFERFYQVDKNSEGVGLGLSIAKSTADRNNWSLTAESNRNTKFILKF